MKIEKIEKEFGYQELKNETYAAVGKVEIKKAYKKVMETKADLRNAHSKALSEPFPESEEKKTRIDLIMYVTREVKALEKALVNKVEL